MRVPRATRAQLAAGEGGPRPLPALRRRRRRRQRWRKRRPQRRQMSRQRQHPPGPARISAPLPPPTPPKPSPKYPTIPIFFEVAFNPPLMRKHPPCVRVTFCPLSLHFFRLRKHRGVLRAVTCEKNGCLPRGGGKQSFLSLKSSAKKSTGGTKITLSFVKAIGNIYGPPRPQVQKKRCPKRLSVSSQQPFGSSWV